MADARAKPPLVIRPTASSVKLARKINNIGPIVKSITEQFAPAIYGKEYRDCLGYAQSVRSKYLHQKYSMIEIIGLPPNDRSELYYKLANMIRHARAHGIVVTVLE